MFQTTRAAVGGDFGVGAERAGAGGAPISGKLGVRATCVAWASGCCRDAAGGLAAFDPVDEVGEGVELVGGGAAAAMRHAGDGKVAGELVAFAALRCVDALQPSHGVVMREDGIAHAVVEQNFGAACTQGIEVFWGEFAGGRDLRVGRFWEAGVGGVNRLEAFVDVDGKRVADGARWGHENIASGGVAGLGFDEFPLRPVAACDAAVVGEAAVDWRAVAGFAACMHSSDVLLLRGAEACSVSFASAGGDIAIQIKGFLASGGVLYEAIFCTVERIAFFQHRAGHGLALLRGEGGVQIGDGGAGVEGVRHGGAGR